MPTTMSPPPVLTAWLEDAACRSMDPSAFFVDGNVRRDLAEACGACPVRAQCLAHALRYEDFGIWAGTTAEQRRRIRSRYGITLERLPEPLDWHQLRGGTA